MGLENGGLKDEELVLLAKADDLSAFEELVRRHQEGLFAFIYRLVNNHTVAEELAQEAWVRAWQNLKGFKQKSGFKTWVFRIGMNLAFNFRTRTKPTEGLTELLPANPVFEPEQVFKQKQREEVVSQALAMLPVDQRTALVLSVYEGMSYKEIARVMKRSVRAVDSLLVRARVNLRQTLAAARKKGLI
ncbi:MAG: RNA polymerase sigma factor [bacterium]